MNNKPLSEETKRKISKAHIGMKLSEETKKKISLAKKGTPAWNKGRPASEEVKERLIMSHKGKAPWNKGKKMPESMGLKMSAIQKGKPKPYFHEEKSSSWKGDDAGYQAIHTWLRNKLGKATLCSNDPTHKAKFFDWANISGEYKRDANDYRSLCRSCHIKQDRKINSGAMKRRFSVIA